MSKRILALNPWHGGSHRAFLDGWKKHSRHEFTVMSLPPSKWKWRMRHGAVTFAEQLRDDPKFRSRAARSAPLSFPGSRLGTHLPEAPASFRSQFDALFCTDMLNLAEFLGLAPQWVRNLPTVAYFHENQLTYPVREVRERDLHFAFSNFTTCLAADAVWFNSAWHRDEFLNALRVFLGRLPDHAEPRLVETVQAKADVQSPGIDSCPIPKKVRSNSEPLRIAWVGRWEHDKNPELFFDSLFELEARGIEFRLCVLGESFAEIPDCFPAAQERLSDRIDQWGFAASRKAYWQILASCDVVVSTADHEFFGIAILEAVQAGCFPLVPRDLAYPETLGQSTANVFHDGTVSGLAGRLEEFARAFALGRKADSPLVDRFTWDQRAAEMDQQIEMLV